MHEDHREVRQTGARAHAARLRPSRRIAAHGDHGARAVPVDKQVAAGPRGASADLSVGLLVHAPFVAGYHAQALDVVRLAVLSAKRNAGRPIHLLVVDNGSCDEVRDWLLDAHARGDVDQLALNGRNLGKVTAVSQILGTAPGTDVVYADGDLCFLPGWTEPLMRLKADFPEAGIIGGAPPVRGIAGDPEAGGGRRAVGEDVHVERGRFVPEAVLRQALGETGYEGPALERQMDRIRLLEDVRLRKGSNAAYLGSTHCLYLVTAAVRRAFTPQVGSLALSEFEDAGLDRHLDSAGLARVSLTRAVYRHVGNRLGAEDRDELERLGVAPASAPGPLRGGVWRRHLVRLAARWMHDQSYRVLSGERPTVRHWVR